MDSLQSVTVFLELWGPELDTELQLWPDKCSVEWDDRVSISAGNAPADAAQHQIGLCCCSGILLTPVQFAVHKEPQVPFSKAVLQPHRSRPALCTWVLLSQVQDFALAFAKLRTVLSSPLF